MKRFFFFFFLTACVEQDISNPCETEYLWDQFSYSTTPDKVTPKYQINVDDSGHNIDLDLVDQIYEETLECVLSADIQDYGFYCSNERVHEPPLGSITVKIPAQYVLGLPGPNQQQLLLDEAPDEGCLEKGLQPTLDKKCRWRAGIQNFCTAVTTPSLYMLKDPFVKIITGCPNIWYVPEYAACASPSVPMMPRCGE